MSPHVFSLTLWFSLLTTLSCKSANDNWQTSKSEGNTPQSKDSMPQPIACSDASLNSFRLAPGSLIKWRMVKLVKDDPNEILVDGSLAVDGLWSFAGDSIQNSNAQFLFNASSVKSDAALRDERIRNYFFLAPQNLPVKLSVNLWESKSTALKEGETAAITAIGKLIIAGRSSPVLKLPLLASKKKNGEIKVTSKDPISLNLRTDDAGNGINLSDRLDELLAHVPGVSLHDSTEISLDLSFKPYSCQ